MFKSDVLKRIREVMINMVNENPEFITILEFSEIFDSTDPEDYEKVKNITDYLKRHLTDEEIDVMSDQIALEMCREFQYENDRENEYTRYKNYVRNTIIFGPPVTK